MGAVQQEEAALDIVAQTMGIVEEEETSETSSSVKFEFDDAFQKRIAALAVRNPKFARRTEGLILPDYFENEAQGFLVDCANRYFEKYRSLPESTSVFVHFLKTRFQVARTRPDFKQEIVEEYRALLKERMNDADYIADQVGEFARHQAVQNAMLESLDLMEKGDMNRIETLMKKAFDVSAANDFVEVDYWNDIERRTQYRQDVIDGKIEKRGIPTGLKKLDKLLYHNGWGRKELSVLMGGAKKGKSTGLGHFAILTSLGGFNTLYVTLEVAGDIISERMDANISKIPMQELNARMDEVFEKVDVRRAAKKGELRIVEQPSGSLSPAGLRRIIERYKADGIQFDCIVVDYADIMRPDVLTSDPIENSKQVWLGLRAIGFEEDAAMLTATQTNRAGFKSDTAKAEDAAEDFNKIRIADIVISINRTDEERARGEARLYFAASRNQGGEFTVGIKQNLETMEFITGVTGIS